MIFQPFPDNSTSGEPLDARVSVTAGSGGMFEVWFRPSGGTQPNTERRQARDLILKRLGEANASIIDHLVGRGPSLLGNSTRAHGPGTRAQDWVITDPKELKTLTNGPLRLLVRLAEQDGWTEHSLCAKLQSGDRNADFRHLPGDTPSANQIERIDVIAKLRAYRNLIVEGVAGTGKSHLIRELRKPENFGTRVKVVVFHPSTSYEDFVEGLRPRKGGFEVRDGDFLQICREAARPSGHAAGGQDDGKPPEWVLVIDEINRANTSKVLGDLLYAIEPSKRVAPARAHAILSATSQEPGDGDSGEPPWTRLLLERVEETGHDAGDGSQRENGAVRPYRQRLAVPDNLYILGTMNTTDRSVGTLDLALRRRFVMHRMNPLEASELKKFLVEKDHGSDLDADVDTWNELNTRLKTSIGPDSMLGHSYFFEFAEARARTDHDDLDLWHDLLLPQLAEIIVAFDAGNRVTDLLNGLVTGGSTIQLVGHGVDAYPMVVRIP